MVGVAINRLLAHEDQIRLLCVDQRFESLGNEKSVELVVVRIHPRGLVRACGQSLTQRGLTLLGPEGHDMGLAQPSLGLLPVFVETKGGLEGVFVKRIGFPLHSCGVDSVATSRNRDLVGVVRIGNALDRYEYLHGVGPLLGDALIYGCVDQSIVLRPTPSPGGSK